VILEKIMEIIKAVETKDLQLISLDQKSQKGIIDIFQNQVHASLDKILPNMNWRSPHKLTQERKDEADIYGTFNSEGDEGAVIIELDKWRADQVAKKFVSRFALTLERPLIYIALCYGGTPDMNKRECEKYFVYCRSICNSFTKLNLRARKRFHGHIIEIKMPLHASYDFTDQ
jgi:hypothetical protein